jgi:hypothetical protein
MVKLILVILLVGLISCPYNYSQQETFGHKTLDNDDIVSTTFLIQDGFVLDSANSNNQIFRFEYNQVGKLSRDINIITLPAVVTVDGHQKLIHIPGCRDFYYNNKGDVDSMVASGWDDSLGIYVDNPYGYTIHYSYDNNGMLLSKTTSNGGVVSSIDKYSYDSAGNLTSIQTTFNGPDTAYVIREYDSLTRLTNIKNIINGTPSGDQYTYSYDSSGNVNCLIQTSNTGKISNKYNYFIKFDESGKVADETDLSMFLSDSTWRDTLEITFNYDEYGRIIQMGQFTWFHYNPDGNLDSMVITHTFSSGYLANKGTFGDSYGNSITLPSYSGINHFYYSSFITGIEAKTLNNKTYTLFQNYPNPFNPSTTIRYSVSKPGLVSIIVYDLLGKKVRTLVNKEQSAGNYAVQFNANELSSGIYFYRIETGNFVDTKKLLLLK